MIGVELVTQGFDFVTGKGLDWFKSIVGELDKRRLINYGEQRVENSNFRKLDELCDGGLTVRRQAERDLDEHGFPEDDKYLRK